MLDTHSTVLSEKEVTPFFVKMDIFVSIIVHCTSNQYYFESKIYPSIFN